MRSSLAIILALIGMAVSLLWTVAPEAESLTAFAKHGKLILVPLLISLIRTRREAFIALAFFGGGQLFLLICTWLLVMGITLPWARPPAPSTVSYAVFSSYLDQSIMSAVLAGTCWHLREFIPSRHGNLLAAAITLAAMACVFFVFPGRTGHAVAITIISMTIMWALPKRFKAAIVIIPFVILSVMVLSSPQVRDRFLTMSTEIQAYRESPNSDNFNIEASSSSGIRLHLWHRSIQAIQQHPISGTGVGSWYIQFNQLEKEVNPNHQDITGNPHQEFLMWGVELGLPGMLLLATVIFCMYLDSLNMSKPIRRAMQITLASLVVSCLFNSSLYDALIGDFFCVAIGLLMALGFAANNESIQASHITPLSTK